MDTSLYKQKVEAVGSSETLVFIYMLDYTVSLLRRP